MPKTVEKFVHLKSSIFPILPDENPEEYEDFFYGKSLCQFLEVQLPSCGYHVNEFVDEDWGWWVSVKNSQKNIELGIYRFTDEAESEFVIRVDFRKSEFFSLRHMKKVSRLADLDGLEKAIVDLMTKTEGVELLSVTDKFPSSPRD